jgi:hypothetical protein
MGGHDILAILERSHAGVRDDRWMSARCATNS